MNNKTRSIIKPWVPRTLAILAICFISIFAFDVFDEPGSFFHKAGDLIIHLIPSFVLLGLLIISWKRPVLGGILLSLVGLGLSIPVFILNYDRTGSILTALWIIFIITFPFVLTGVLFIMSGRKNSAPSGK